MQTTRSALGFQLDMAWQLLTYHFDGLTDQEAYWLSGERGLQVRSHADSWVVDWPESEGYDIGPASVAWVMWHIIFWWSMALDHSFGSRSLSREDVIWPGSVGAAVSRIEELHGEWIGALGNVTDEQLAADGLTRWPFGDRPFYEVVAWLNMELMKNAAEIGYGRFLYAGGRSR